MLNCSQFIYTESYKAMMLYNVLYKHEIKWSAMR